MRLIETYDTPINAIHCNAMVWRIYYSLTRYCKEKEEHTSSKIDGEIPISNILMASCSYCFFFEQIIIHFSMARIKKKTFLIIQSITSKCTSEITQLTPPYTINWRNESNNISRIHMEWTIRGDNWSNVNVSTYLVSVQVLYWTLFSDDNLLLLLLLYYENGIFDRHYSRPHCDMYYRLNKTTWLLLLSRLSCYCHLTKAVASIRITIS